jgi:hypothetical protein
MCINVNILFGGSIFWQNSLSDWQMLFTYHQKDVFSLAKSQIWESWKKGTSTKNTSWHDSQLISGKYINILGYRTICYYYIITKFKLILILEKTFFLM